MYKSLQNPACQRQKGSVHATKRSRLLNRNRHRQQIGLLQCSPGIHKSTKNVKINTFNNFNFVKLEMTGPCTEPQTGVARYQIFFKLLSFAAKGIFSILWSIRILFSCQMNLYLVRSLTSIRVTAKDWWAKSGKVEKKTIEKLELGVKKMNFPAPLTRSKTF